MIRVEKTADGWIVRVPDEAIDYLGLNDKDPVIIRADEVVRAAIAELRGRVREYPQDAT